MTRGVRAVLSFAIITRLGSLLLQALLNAAIPDHDADAFSPPPAEDPLLLDPVVELLLGGLGRWDAQHFLFIAERGYVFEHNFAFFPLLPILLRCIAVWLLWPLGPWLSLHGRLLVAVALVNSVLFFLSVVTLYGLSCLVLQDRRLSLLSALLYCLTPANVFLMAGYSESLYAMLTFGGLWLLERGSTASACLVLGLGTGARANGLVNAGFLLYLSLQRALFRTKQLRTAPRDGWNFLWCTRIAINFVVTAAFGVLVISLPFAVFQYYAYSRFCETPSTLEPVSPILLSLAQAKGYLVPGPASSAPPWCSRPLPLLYSYLQDVYWDVGFLRYFQLKQIPNFLLASPVAALGSLAACVYFRADPRYCLCLGLVGGDSSKEKDEKDPTGFHSRRAFVYVVHATALLLSGFFCMHVQVLTRFLGSSSPVIYWISAHCLLSHEPLLAEDHAQEKNEQMPVNCSLFGIPWGRLHQNPITELLMAWGACSFWTKCILGYFMSYWVIGLALHCNFLPWT